MHNLRKMIKINNVFKTVGFPKHTYVERDNGRFENILKSGIRDSGTISVLTGPSKTGKTLLYKKVLQNLGLIPLTIRCNKELTINEIWKKALEQVKFNRVKNSEKSKSFSHSQGGKISSELGFKWLAKIVGEISFDIDNEKSEREVRELVLSNPSPNHLLPILQNTNYFLIIEDFHYLKKTVQEVLFQQWKTFIDNEVSAIVVGTTHHLVDINFSKVVANEKIYSEEVTTGLSEIRNRVITEIPCGAGYNTFTFNGDGSIYSCQNLAHIEDCKIGSIYEDIDNNKRNLFKAVNVNNIEQCKNCWIKNLCSGGCFAQRYTYDNSMDLLPEDKCNLEKIRWKYYLQLYQRIINYNPNYFDEEKK